MNWSQFFMNGSPAACRHGETHCTDPTNLASRHDTSDKHNIDATIGWLRGACVWGRGDIDKLIATTTLLVTATTAEKCGGRSPTLTMLVLDATREATTLCLLVRVVGVVGGKLWRETYKNQSFADIGML